MKSPNRTLLWPIFIARRIAAAIRPTKAVGIGGLKVKKPWTGCTPVCLMVDLLNVGEI